MTEQKPEHPKAELHVPAERKGKSKGEKFFDRFVYGGIAGVGTFVVTLGVAMSIKFGRGRQYYSRAVEWMTGKLGRVLPGESARKFSEEFVQTTTLMQGGNLMLLPVGVAEHYKVPIVSGLNTAMGDTTPPEKIEEAPKQTWWSLIEGRALAWTAVFGTLFGASMLLPKSFKTFTSEFGERVHNLVGKFKTVRSSPVMNETRSYRVGELAALDIFATAAAATLLYIGGHFFARRHEEKKEIKEARHHHGDPQRDAAEAGEPVSTTAAHAEVSGEKQHEGRLKESKAIAAGF